VSKPWAFFHFRAYNSAFFTDQNVYTFLTLPGEELGNICRVILPSKMLIGMIVATGNVIGSGESAIFSGYSPVAGCRYRVKNKSACWHGFSIGHLLRSENTAILWHFRNICILVHPGTLLAYSLLDTTMQHP